MSQNIPTDFPMDISSIMKTAQELAKNMENGKSVDFNQMFSELTQTVFYGAEKNGMTVSSDAKKQIENMTKSMTGMLMEEQKHQTPVHSKIMLEDAKMDNGSYEVLIDGIVDEIKCKSIEPYVDDTIIKLDVSLEEMYTGKTKKLAITRERISASGKISEEKRKFEVCIKPGMRHKHEIRFNKQGNEKIGCESGDIVIILSESIHPIFERVGKHSLCVVKNISLYESYAFEQGLLNIVIKHLDGHDLVLTSDGYALHRKDGTRKITGYGMPYVNNGRIEYGDLFVRFNIILPDSFTGDDSIKYIEKLFPILQGNKDFLLIKSIPHTAENFNNLKEVQLETVTPEDMEQLEYETDSDDESSGSED